MERIKSMLTQLKSLFKPQAVLRNNNPIVIVKPKALIDWEKTGFNQTLPFTNLVLHCSATFDGSVKNTDEIWKYHTSYRIDHNTVTKEEWEKRFAAGQGKKFEKPWLTIGYNLLIERVAGVLQVIIGRPLSMRGAHCEAKNMNLLGIGLCVIGTFNTAAPDPELWDFTLKAVREIQGMYRSLKVSGHRERDSGKACPGLKFDLNAFRNAL